MIFLCRVKACKVRYSPDGRNAKILGGTVVKVIPQSISMKKFSIEDSDGKKRQISIYDYYVDRYGRKDLEKDGPCLELNGEKFVPAEVGQSKIISSSHIDSSEPTHKPDLRSQERTIDQQKIVG